MGLADLVFVLVLIVFFGLAALMVVVCDRIIGSHEEAFAEVGPESVESESLAA